MISFKDFLSSFNKKFVCLYFDDNTNKQLMQYAINNGFNLEVGYDGDKQNPKDFDFHITVFYTSTSHNTENTTIKIDPIRIELTKPLLLGKDKNVPVLGVRLTSKLRKLRDIFQSQGYRDVWPNYKPHISLSYDKRSYDLSDMTLPNFEIIANRLEIKNQTT